MTRETGQLRLSPAQLADLRDWITEARDRVLAKSKKPTRGTGAVAAFTDGLLEALDASGSDEHPTDNR